MVPHGRSYHETSIKTPCGCYCYRLRGLFGALDALLGAFHFIFSRNGKSKQVASGPLWRRWHIALEDRQAAEQLIKNYELWADAEHWYPKTDRKYGVLRQWVSFIDATKTPPHYVTQWGDVREDRRGLRLLHLSVRNEYVFDDNSPELGLSTHPKGRYDCYITLELHP